MIPLRLTLKNFLSYRDATLDFNGLHTACICGSNGAGKSSLLEAITWALWGQSRAATEDDVIHGGEKEVRVDFLFQCNEQIYRIIRTRYRGGSSSLEFQIATGFNSDDTPTFRPLTERGVRATQLLILHHLKLDYDTFINSAYLRQGRADEFMLKRPTERKQILADLLKLSQYEELAEQSKDLSRQFKGQSEQLEQNLQVFSIQLQQREAIAQQQTIHQANLQELQQSQTVDNEQLQKLQSSQHQRQNWEQQLTWQRQQYQHLTQDCDRFKQQQAATQQQLQKLATLLAQTEQITAGHTHYENLQTQDELLAAKFQAYQDAQQQRQQLQTQLNQQINELNLQLRQSQGQLEILRNSRTENQQILSRVGEVETALKQLAAARNQLSELDRLQLQVSPLLQRRHALQNELDRAYNRLNARLEELHSTASQMQAQQQRQPRLQQAVIEVGGQLDQLEKKRVYQQRVQEKGLERRSFRDRLQENQREYEAKLAELAHKIQMLQGHGVYGTGQDSEESPIPNPQSPVAFPPCPLCDRPLDEHHWQRVIHKTQTQQQELNDQFWVVRDQLAACERELQVLRNEYSELNKELAPYDDLREQRGQLAAQLEATNDIQTRLQQLLAEAGEIERSLVSGNYALDRQEELRDIEQQIQQLNYDEKNHALARGEVDRWRWAEIKQAEIKQVQQRQAQIDAQMPELLEKIADLQAQMQQLQIDSDLSKQIENLDLYIIEMGYDRAQHEALRTAVRQAQSWQLRYQELQQAQQQQPILQERSQELANVLQGRLQDLQLMTVQLEALVKQLEQMPDTKREIQVLEQQIHQRRRQLDDHLAELGKLQAHLTQMESLQTQYEQQQQQLIETRRQYRIYQELSQAFGKNGIQALMIENVLPQLEAETNLLLARLSANQLHVQFVTQKAGRGGKSSSKKNAKMIDTLDILIADARGTRPYETYSGGEAFRINFAIRLALARMLAQRAGTALQMLIVDEGFGTQDQEGCDRLIAAINAIASDFACILTVTHMPYFREAFQARIEVHKTQNGSKLSLSI